MKLLGIEVTERELNYLTSENAKGKDLKVIDGKVVAVEHKPTEEELLQKELTELELWFNWYDNQVAQYNRCQRLGIEFDKDIVELDNLASLNQKRIAEIREILKEKL